jgi:hypothetical protein
MPLNMPQQITRHNHYVPVWHQKGFIVGPGRALNYLDLNPPSKILPDGRKITGRSITERAPKSCFWSEDLYTIQFGSIVNDEIERFLFGKIDDFGARSVRAFAGGDPSAIHNYFQLFFDYLDAQKIRTPKGLDWIKSKYPNLTQLDLMIEMQALRQMHCTMWYESVKEIVSADQSNVKFIVTDHPVTIYNAAFPPTSTVCIYPNDPAIELIGSQTVFPLDANNCLILTNLEYAKNPDKVDLKAPRTHARYGGQTIARTDAIIRTRKLTNEEVKSVNLLLKSRARRFIAAGDKKWLEPEFSDPKQWRTIGNTLLPPPRELWHFGGKLVIGYKDGTSHYQDEFGRTSGAHKYLTKKRTSTFDKSGMCGCGSGRRFKLCCAGIVKKDRPSWDVYSIRERNLIFIRSTQGILGLHEGKTWEDVRKEISDDQVKRIHEVYESLWPKDTDLAELLPPPNEKILRTVYQGMVDPRTIGITVTAWLPYFDEIIIASPFINAGSFKPEFSPTKSPKKYKVQSLKNIAALLVLEPFIDTGIVHMLPDPTDFGDIRSALWGMAEQRVGDERDLDDEDVQRHRELAKDDMMRATRGLPKDALRNIIKRASPDLSTAQIDEAVEYMQDEQKQDPMALLQDLPPGEDGAQLQTIKGFNLESALFLAQFTGSVVFTDLKTHWRHLHEHATAADSPGEPTHWLPVINSMEKIPFQLKGSPQEALQLRLDGKHDRVREMLRGIFNYVHLQEGKPISKQDQKKFKNELGSAKKYLRKEWRGTSEGHLDSLQGNLVFSVPLQGFNLNTVHRLLLTYGRKKRGSGMPLAIFVQLTPNT